MRRDFWTRELVARLQDDLKAGRIDSKLAAHRMNWHGVPFHVALRVIAGR